MRTGGIVLTTAVIWLALFALTPGLRAAGLGSLVSDDGSVQVLLESIVALLVLAVLMALQVPAVRAMFAGSRLVMLYAVPLVLMSLMPLHYGLPLPPEVYAAWITVSVIWQIVLTFGLLQHRLGEHLGPRATILLTAVLFWLGHVVYLPGSFAPTTVSGILAGASIVAMGLLFAWIRHRTGTVHLLLVLHLSFYMVAV